MNNGRKSLVSLRYNSYGVKIFPEISPGFLFKEVIPSFNFSSNSNLSYKAEIKVKNKSGKWSDWLFFGSWGKTIEEGKKTDGVVKVDIDYISSDEPLKSCVLRVISDDPNFYSGSVSFAFSELKYDEEKKYDSEYIPKKNYLNVPFRTQTKEEREIAEHVCQSASICMIMESYGKKVETKDFAKLTYDKYYGMYGLWWRAAQTAYLYGFPSYVRYFSSLYEAEELINEGIPVAACVAYAKNELTGSKTESSAGHVTVICGFDEKGNALCLDSAERDETKGLTVYPRAEYAKAWLSNAGGVGYVIERTRQSNERIIK